MPKLFSYVYVNRRKQIKLKVDPLYWERNRLYSSSVK